MAHSVPEVVQEQQGHVLADTQPDQDPLYGYVSGRAGKGVGGHLPSSCAQPVGQIKQCVAGSSPWRIRQVTVGMPVAGLLSHRSSNGPSLTISAARYWPTA